MHLSTVVMRTFDHPDTQDQFRQLVRSYRKLVLLIEAGDTEGAERHWRTHMEVVGRKLLPGDAGAKTAVDLFGYPPPPPNTRCRPPLRTPGARQASPFRLVALT